MARRSKNVKKEIVEEVKTEETVEPLVNNEEPKQEARYFVARNKHVNCRRGIVKPNVEVFPSDFPGGTMTMDEHVKNGGLVKR